MASPYCRPRSRMASRILRRRLDSNHITCRYSRVSKGPGTARLNNETIVLGHAQTFISICAPQVVRSARLSDKNNTKVNDSGLVSFSRTALPLVASFLYTWRYGCHV
ncbi:hypothetical protein E4T38_04017 [Aureobasidium subglaciale]|nr:hypothetical protein E4T38_04017 [Aureobasidium subglaciale]KAI5224912.1 hypothetical protein E4T40_03792 [Aureobasidium subglaciale]KAI5227966.1 hypothetical protein E4T41_04012 [Aureobasidium subglaciale]KAI5263443.1 hypothetical protein E4T46_03633 [Aureobasidium subglaciale]